MAPAEPSEQKPVESFLKSGARWTAAAHFVWAELVSKGATVVDATVGNGHDTAVLAQLVGPTGLVHGFDIQEAAIAATTRRVADTVPAEQRPALRLVRACHSTLLSHVVPGSVRLVCFNLGYLPSADKTVITQRSSTLAAIQAALEALEPGGMLSVMCYTGHEGGMEEYQAVTTLLAGLQPHTWTTMEHRLLNRPTAPVLQLAWRRPDAPAE